MEKLWNYILTSLMIFSLFIAGAMAIPTRDKQASIEGYRSYGLDIQDYYPNKELNTAEDYYKLGIAYLSRNTPQQATEQFQKAIKINPNHVPSLIGLSASLSQSGDINTAMEYSNKALKIEPNNGKIHNAIGILHYANATSVNQLKQAEASFKKAISLDSDLLVARINLARLYTSMKNLDGAIREYESVIKLQPDNLAARAELSRVYLYNRNIDKAMQESEKAVQIAPKNPMARNALGEIYLYKGQLDKAQEEFKKCLELEPSYSIAYKNIGRVYMLKNSMDKAIEEFKNAVSYNPNFGEAYYGLGDAYLTKGMIKEAVEGYKNAIRVLPASALISVPVYNNLAYIYAEEDNKLDEALSMAQKAKQLAPDQPDVSDTLGWIYYKKGMYKEAITYLKEAVSKQPDNPIMRYHLGAAYHKQGLRNEAIKELESSLSKGKSFEESEDAKRLLSSLKSN